MRAFSVGGFAAVLLLLGSQAVAPARAAEDVAAVLQGQAQDLFDAISSGKGEVWDRLLDADARITAEDGSVSTKAEMVAQVKPLPEGVSGTITVTDFQATVHGSVAIATYVTDEHEQYHGHSLHCHYRSTDTWVRSPAGWRLLASQVLALRTDPPAIELAPEQVASYLGRYNLAPGIDYEIRLVDGALQGQRSGRPAETLRVEAPDVLFVPGSPRYRKIFHRDAAGKVTGFAERREAWDLDWSRVGDRTGG